MQVKDAFGQGLFLIYKVFRFCPKGRFLFPDIRGKNKKARSFGPDNIFNLSLFNINVNNFQQNEDIL